MSKPFSLIEALEALIIDPFPTKKFRAIVKLLKDLKTILEELNQAEMCCISDILRKLAIPLPEPVDDTRTRLIPTVEVFRVLSQLNIASKLNSTLIKLLRYIIMKLNNCSGDDAASILYDFKELIGCFSVFRTHPVSKNPRMDEIMAMFSDKLIQMMKNLNADDYNEKFRLFGIMRIMIVEFGKHPVFAARIVRKLYEEIKLYYEKMDLLAPDEDMDAYIFEYHFAYLYILNEIIGGIFRNNVECPDLVSELRNILHDALVKKKTCNREEYLVQNILRVIDVYSSAKI